MESMKVLVATDGSACADVALQLVRTIDWPENSEIHVVTVVDSAIPQYPYAADDARGPSERNATLIGGVEADLAGIALSLERDGLTIEPHVLVGRAASAIVDEARALGVDLAIVGSRGHGTIGSMLLGSVSAEVADHANCPVLIARRSSWSRVVLAVDGSKNNERAIEIVQRWPIFARCSIDVVSVAPTMLGWTSTLALSSYAGSFDYAETHQAQVEDHRRWAERAVRRIKSSVRHASTNVVDGNPATELIRIASDDDADVVIVGTRGQGGLTRLLVGSVARNVILHAGTSVLVVKEAQLLP